MRRLIIFALTFLALISMPFLAPSAKAQGLDLYRGQTDIPCNGGAKARFYTEKRTDGTGVPRWYICTPSGNSFFAAAVFNMATDGGTDQFGINNDTLITSKYGGGTGFCQNEIRRAMAWGINVLGPGTFGCNPYNLTAPYRLPFAGNAWVSHYSRTNAAGYGTGNAKGFQAGLKGGVGVRQADPFDSNWISWLTGYLASGDSFTTGCLSGPQKAYCLGMYLDDSDSVDLLKGGLYGVKTLSSSPLQYAGTTADGDTANNVFYPVGTFYAKQQIANWLQGTTDSTGSVTASRSGSTVTYTVGAGNLYNAHDVVTVKGCSDATFNTVAGTGVTVTSITSTTVVGTLAGAGATATGCTMTTGPGYTLGGLNTAWGSNYDTFGSDATNFTAEAYGTGNGVLTSFNHSFANSPVTPDSVQVLVSAAAVGGDDCYNANTGPCGAGVTGSFKGPTVSGSSLTYSSGVSTLVFTAAPANAAPITVNYSTGGWGAGHGVLDEDGTCPSKLTTCWITVNPAAFQTDMNNWSYYIAKAYFSKERTALRAADANLMYLGAETGKAPICQTLQAEGQYVDIIPGDGNSFSPPGYGSTASVQAQLNALYACSPDVPVMGANYTSASTDDPYTSLGDFDYTTQPLRGIGFQTTMNAWLSLVDSTYSSAHVVGYEWWQWFDQRNENTNWGLVTNMDDPLDGHSASSKAGIDAYGFYTGCFGHAGGATAIICEPNGVHTGSLGTGDGVTTAFTIPWRSIKPGSVSLSTATQVASDNFQRANANPIGGNWSTVSGNHDLQIVSNVVEPVDTVSGGNAAAIWNANAFGNDQYSQFVIGTIEAGSSMTSVVRGVSGSNNYYGCKVKRNESAIITMIAGSESYNSVIAAAIANGDTLNCQVKGTTITLFQNGVQLSQATNASLTSGSAGAGFESVVSVAGSTIAFWSGGSFNSCTDDGNGNLTGNAACSGTINYVTGAVVFNLPPGANTPITATITTVAYGNIVDQVTQANDYWKNYSSRTHVTGAVGGTTH